MSQEDNKDYLVCHKEAVQKVLENQPEENYLYDLAELFKVFGDSTRIRILYALIECPLCVSDLSSILSMSQSAISHQLRILKDSKLVKYKREGQMIVYALDDEHVRTLLNVAMNHLEE